MHDKPISTEAVDKAALPAGAGSDRGIEPPAPAEGDADASTWKAPWVATAEHPAGAAEVPVPPQIATGHYGAGYDDPTRHYGNTLPGQADLANATAAASTAE
ncbi:MAG: hypothetical protein M3Y67_06715, partial [Pseudomonadota bacterium]|nr:hypothetical protein [Pseudomonadota bacterium]